MFTNNLLDIFITFPVTNCESGQQGSEEKLKLSFFSNVNIYRKNNKLYKYSNKLFGLHTDFQLINSSV